ncbi:hypothetical protein ACWGQT_28280 [Streptomyces yangpuensis]
MGVQERERKIYRPLRQAGLEVIPGAVPDGTIPVVRGYGREDVVGGFSHAYETPQLVKRLNEDWYELAVSAGLLDHRREFLVMLPRGITTPKAWLRSMHGGPPRTDGLDPGPSPGPLGHHGSGRGVEKTVHQPLVQSLQFTRP